MKNTNKAFLDATHHNQEIIKLLQHQSFYCDLQINNFFKLEPICMCLMEKLLQGFSELFRPSGRDEPGPLLCLPFHPDPFFPFAAHYLCVHIWNLRANLCVQNAVISFHGFYDKKYTRRRKKTGFEKRKPSKRICTAVLLSRHVKPDVTSRLCLKFCFCSWIQFAFCYCLGWKWNLSRTAIYRLRSK